MILLGIKNDTHIVASISRYDYITHDDLMMDGGQPTTLNYTGYYKFSGGNPAWFRIPQRYSEIHADYSNNKDRKYGVWKIEDVEILPGTLSEDLLEEQKIENALWGTYDKKSPNNVRYVHLVDCDDDHLRNIIELTYVSNRLKDVIYKILENRKTEK
jgi:hypothetical protein